MRVHWLIDYINLDFFQIVATLNKLMYYCISTNGLHKEWRHETYIETEHYTTETSILLLKVKKQLKCWTICGTIPEEYLYYFRSIYTILEGYLLFSKDICCSQRVFLNIQGEQSMFSFLRTKERRFQQLHVDFFRRLELPEDATKYKKKQER